MQRAISEYSSVQNVRLDDILPISFLSFRISEDAPEELDGLAESIRKHGVLEPALVRRRRNNGGSRVESRPMFELISGSRRFAASKKIGLSAIPCVVVNVDDQAAFEIALIENLQRKNLSPIEEAEAFKVYVTNFGRGSVTRLARKIGKSEEYVSHRLLLLGLPKILADRISRRLLNPSIATELVWLKDEERQIELADKVKKYHLSFREIRYAIRLVRTEGVSVDRATEMTLKTRKEITVSKEDSAGERSMTNDPWPSWKEPPNEAAIDRHLRAIEHAVLIVRSALSGLDLLAQKSADEPDLRATLMRERRSIHAVLDNLIRAKVSYKKKAKSYASS